jgi:hypothetical protein
MKKISKIKETTIDELIIRHDKRLDKLEDDMRVIKTLLEKKLGRSIPKS